VRHWGGRIARDTEAAAHRDAPLSVLLDSVALTRTEAALWRSGLGSNVFGANHAVPPAAVSAAA
jgi:hypothetical protein